MRWGDFFFSSRRRHTRSLRDWSSDVCSSDLWSCRGAHRGDLSGIAPTGKQFVISGVTVVRFTDGKIVEGWINWDALGLMQQLGVVPELGKAKAAAAAR